MNILEIPRKSGCQPTDLLFETKADGTMVPYLHWDHFQCHPEGPLKIDLDRLKLVGALALLQKEEGTCQQCVEELTCRGLVPVDLELGLTIGIEGIKEVIPPDLERKFFRLCLAGSVLRTTGQPYLVDVICFYHYTDGTWETNYWSWSGGLFVGNFYFLVFPIDAVIA